MKLGIVVLVALCACGPKVGINETRMVFAPSRPANCDLQLVQVDITAVEFNQTWEVLGYVILLDRGMQDSSSEENRGLVRPRACAMGGNSIAIAMNSASQSAMGLGSGLAYMVMRPKSWAQGPEKF